MWALSCGVQCVSTCTYVYVLHCVSACPRMYICVFTCSCGDWYVCMYISYVCIIQHECDEQYCSFLYKWVQDVLSCVLCQLLLTLQPLRNHTCVLSGLPVICVTMDTFSGCFCYLDNCVRESVAYCVCRVEALWCWHAGGRI